MTKVFRPGVKKWSTFEYDAAGRTTKVVHSDGTSERFAHDEDGALVEAAYDLGAKPWRVLVHVILPLTRPGIVAAALFVFIPSIGMFAIAALMGGDRVPLVGNVIQNQFGQGRDWPFGAALGTALLVLFLALLAWALRKDGEEALHR